MVVRKQESRGMGVTANKHRFSLWHNENILELDDDLMVAQH